jgi:hypothetical protein
MTFPRKARDGDYLVVDDRTGFTTWASKTQKEKLTGHRVRTDSADPIHPQEIARAPRAEKQFVPDPRPPGVTRVTGPLSTVTTAAATAGATNLTVETTARMEAGDRVRIALASADYFETTLQAVPSSTSITIAAALPGNVESGAVVIDVTAMATPDLG